MSMNHPCFCSQDVATYSRIHLPVAPKCNIKCFYCDKSGACVNENRPGVASKVLNPQEAFKYFEESMLRYKNISVAGISGPGDPLANIDNTLETFYLIHRKYPNINLCLSTNGVNFSKYYKELIDVGVKFLTLTINTLKVDTAAQIYELAHDGNEVLYGTNAAQFIVDRQAEAMHLVKKYKSNFVVKMNMVYLPTLNDNEVMNVVEMAKLHNVNIFNLMPYIKNEHTDIVIPDVTKEEINNLRHIYQGIMPQMFHCKQCRADAIGLIK